MKKTVAIALVTLIVLGGIAFAQNSQEQRSQQKKPFTLGVSDRTARCNGGGNGGCSGGGFGDDGGDGGDFNCH
jgi:hypothetical protein